MYILASRRNGTLYTGVTSDLVRRIHLHRTKTVEGFTSRYDVIHLVWFKQHQETVRALQRERNIKHWSRRWKIELIETANPSWRDLYDEICR